MSFGVVQSAISSIESNRKLLSKRSKFKNGLVVKKSNKVEFEGSVMGFNELSRLKKKLKLENKLIRIKRLVVFGFIMGLFLFAFAYLLF